MEGEKGSVFPCSVCSSPLHFSIELELDSETKGPNFTTFSLGKGEEEEQFWQPPKVEETKIARFVDFFFFLSGGGGVLCNVTTLLLDRLCVKVFVWVSVIFLSWILDKGGGSRLRRGGEEKPVFFESSLSFVVFIFLWRLFFVGGFLSKTFHATSFHGFQRIFGNLFTSRGVFFLLLCMFFSIFSLSFFLISFLFFRNEGSG